MSGSVSADPRVGTEIAGYRVEAVLGRGAGGDTLRAVDPAGGRRVVLKLIDVGHHEVRGRMERICGQFHEPGDEAIVRVLGLPVEEDRLVVVREWVDGDDLAGLLKAEATLDPHAAVDLVSQAARGLDAARWGRGVVHGNLKPSNILVARAADPQSVGRVGLVDFGLWQSVDRAAPLAKAQREAAVGYLAPEQVLGEEPTARSDQYALACVLYECLTGRPPLARDASAIPAAHLKERPSPVSESRPEVREAIDRAIARALAKRPEDRYSSCVEFASALCAESAADDEPEQVPSLRRRSPVQESLPAGADEVAEASECLRAHEPAVTTFVREQAVTRPAPARDRSRRVALAVIAVAAITIAVSVAFLAASDGSEPSSGGTDRLAGGAEPVPAGTEPDLAAPAPIPAPPPTPTTTAPPPMLSTATWSRVAHDEVVFGGAGEHEMTSVIAGGPGLVAVGFVDAGDSDRDAAVWTSADGVAWSRVADDDAVFGGDGEQSMLSVTAGGPGLVAVGRDGFDHAAVWTSVDGVSWTRVPHDDSVLVGSEQSMTSVTAGGPGLVAVGLNGSDAGVWTSVDGLTWSRVPRDEAVFGGDGFQSMVSVTVGGPGLVAVGTDESEEGALDGLRAAVWTSVDGLTWSRAPHDEAVFGNSHVMTGVTAGGPGLVAVGLHDFPGLPVAWTSVDGITWTRSQVGITGRVTMRSVGAGGPGLVAVGQDGTYAAVWTSVDGVSWSRLPRDELVFGGLGDQSMSSVTVGGPGLVAVGSESLSRASGADDESDVSGAAVWTSADGVTWSRVPRDGAIFGREGEQSMLSVTAGGPGLVAVGRDGDAVVWTSADGVAWSRVADDDAVFGGDGEQSMLSVTAGGPGLVAVGRDGRYAAVWTSVDGLSWSRLSRDEAMFGGEGGQVMRSVTAGGPGLVAVGSDGSRAAVWTSVDGFTWSRGLANEQAVFGGVGEQSMLSVTAGGPGLVAVGTVGLNGRNDAAVWTSVDGVTWLQVRRDDAVLGGAGNQSMDSVTAGGPGLVAVGSDESRDGRAAAVWTSVDGLGWSRVPHDEAVFGGEGDEGMSSATVGGPGLVAVGEAWYPEFDGSTAGVWASADGLTWSRVPLDEAGFFLEHARSMRSVVAVGPGLVGVGWDGSDAAVWEASELTHPRDGAVVRASAVEARSPAPSASTWSRVSLDESVFGGDGDQEMVSVVAGRPGLVAVGSDQSDGSLDAVVWTSVDGVTWSRVFQDQALFGREMLSVTAGGPGLVAVGWAASPAGQVAAVWASADGLSWSRVPQDEAVPFGEREQGMRSVTAGGPGLVAVGWDGSRAAVWTSVDGLTWSRVPHDDESLFSGERVMSSVIVGGPGLVAVGSDGPDAAVWTSVDGLTWVQVADDEAVFGGDILEASMSSVTAGGPGLVAVGWDGSHAAVWTSVDGLSWSRAPDDVPFFGGVVNTSHELLSVTAGGPGLVAVGSDRFGGIEVDAVVWTSVDGITWSRVPDEEAVFGGEHAQAMNSVISAGPRLVAVGSGGSDAAAWSSVDGVSWSRVSQDESVFGGAGEQWISSVTAGGPGLVAVGGDGLHAAVWTSVDGLTWSHVTPSPGSGSTIGGSEPAGMNRVIVGGPGLVAVGWDGSGAAVWTSVDGLAWSRVVHDELVFGGAQLSSVTVGGPGLVAVGSDGPRAAVWTSVDGVTWSRVAPDDAVFRRDRAQSMVSVTVGGPGLVAVGSDEPLEGPDEPPRGSDAAVWTSADGLTWVRVPREVAAFGGDGDQGMFDVTLGGPGLVAVGADGRSAAVWTSVDGVGWSRVPDDAALFGGVLAHEMLGVTAGGPGLVAVGLNGSRPVVWTSVDGVRWSRASQDEAVFGGELNGVTAGGPGLVAVGSDGSDATVWVAATVAEAVDVGGDGVEVGGDGREPLPLAPGSIVRIDPETNQVTAIETGLGGVGEGLSVAVGEGMVWAWVRDGRILAHIDPESNIVVGTVEIVGEAIGSVAIGEGSVWVTSMLAGEAVLVESAADTGRFRRAVRLGYSNLTALAVGDGALWVVAADAKGNVALRIDSTTGEVVAAIPLSDRPGEVAVGQGAVWVVGGGDNSQAVLWRIDPATNDVVATFEVPGLAGSPSVATGLGAVWVHLGGPGDLLRIDPATNRITETIPAPWSDGPLAAGRGSIWVMSNDGGTIKRVDPATGQVTATIQGDCACSVAFGAGGVWTS